MRDWNASESGSWLPSEVLARAFTFLPLRDRIPVSHVSHHWRQAALAFPEVWNHIDLQPGRLKCAALVELALSRCGQIPVLISHTAGADPKGVLTLADALPAVQRSPIHDVGVHIHKMRTDAILPICQMFTVNAVDLSLSLSPGADESISLTVSTNHGLVRRLWFTGLPPRPNGSWQDGRALVGFVLRGSGLDGLHILTVDSTMLSNLPTHLPPCLSHLTIHMRELERRDDAETRVDGSSMAVDVLVRSMVTWDWLDVLPRLTMRTQAPVHVLLEMHGGDLLTKHARRLLDKIVSLALSHLPPVRIRGFDADVVRPVSRQSVSDRVVFET